MQLQISLTIINFRSTGEERFAAGTQFASTDARRCFPCWDEPAIKATFDMTLIVPEDRVALSNMVNQTKTYGYGQFCVKQLVIN